jgi:hypothetical protein
MRFDQQSHFELIGRISHQEHHCLKDSKIHTTAASLPIQKPYPLSIVSGPRSIDAIVVFKHSMLSRYRCKKVNFVDTSLNGDIVSLQNPNTQFPLLEATSRRRLRHHQTNSLLRNFVQPHNTTPQLPLFVAAFFLLIFVVPIILPPDSDESDD